MAFKIELLRKERAGGEYVSDRRICISANGELVDCTDTRAVSLLLPEGGRMPWEEAEFYGLVRKDEPKESKERFEDKRDKRPIKNKKRR